MRGAGGSEARSARGRRAFQTIEFATQRRKIEIGKRKWGVERGGLEPGVDDEEVKVNAVARGQRPPYVLAHSLPVSYCLEKADIVGCSRFGGCGALPFASAGWAKEWSGRKTCG